MDIQDRVVERRVYRQPLPSCEKCARMNAHVATRTEHFLYMRCPHCLHTWSIRKNATAACRGRITHVIPEEQHAAGRESVAWLPGAYPPGHRL